MTIREELEAKVKEFKGITSAYDEATNVPLTLEQEAEKQKQQQEFNTNVSAAASKDEQWRSYTMTKDVLALVGSVIMSAANNITGFESPDELRAKAAMVTGMKRVASIVNAPNTFRINYEASLNQQQ